ncbi:MAG: DUF1569 domain-containing protein [Gemmatimonadales bacterium]|nr:MAG: DUF1569 domain-containing protein [Gemmatimonadales bacterium]
MNDIFDPAVTRALIDRIHSLEPDAQPEWGTMNAAQMLAHCCVIYDLAFDPDPPRPGPIKGFLLKTFVKKAVVGEKPYRRSTPTAPEFRIEGEREFHLERDRLVAHLERCRELGREHFDGRDYPNFGTLTADEWSRMFYKHLDHHLTQFGV